MAEPKEMEQAKSLLKKASDELAEKNKQIANLEKEVNSLRNMPLEEESFSTESETTGS